MHSPQSAGALAVWRCVVARKGRLRGVLAWGRTTSSWSPEHLNPPPERGAGDGDGPACFRASATDRLWSQDADPYEKLRQKLRDAFTPSQPVMTRRRLAGRTAVLQGAISAIEHQRQHLVVYGPRGVGKTSLLHTLAEAAREARYIVHYASCGAASGFAETFRAAAGDIPLLFHDDYGPTTADAEAGGALADVLPAEGLTPRQFGEACARLAGTRVLIFLDEFDRAPDSAFRREVAELMKLLSDRAMRVQLVVAGVAADAAELVDHLPSVRRNIRQLRLPLMSPDGVREMLRLGARASELRLDPSAEARVIEIAAGWPHLAALLAQRAASCALDDRRTTIEFEDVTLALRSLTVEMGRLPSVQQRAGLEQLIDGGQLRPLIILARRALRTGEAFGCDAAEVGEGAAANRLAAELAREGLVLVDARSAGDAPSYAFTDEVLPLLVWFVANLDQAPEAAEARRPSSAAFVAAYA